MPLTEERMQRRLALCEFWELGYADGEQMSIIAHAFFARFVEQFHPELALSKEERDLTAMMRSPVPDALSAEIESLVRTVARETAVSAHLLRAFAHGRSTRNAEGSKEEDARTLLQQASLTILRAFEREPRPAR